MKAPIFKKGDKVVLTPEIMPTEHTCRLWPLMTSLPYATVEHIEMDTYIHLVEDPSDGGWDVRRFAHYRQPVVFSLPDELFTIEV